MLLVSLAGRIIVAQIHDAAAVGFVLKRKLVPDEAVCLIIFILLVLLLQIIVALDLFAVCARHVILGLNFRKSVDLIRDGFRKKFFNYKFASIK